MASADYVLKGRFAAWNSPDDKDARLYTRYGIVEGFIDGPAANPILEGQALVRSITKPQWHDGASRPEPFNSGEARLYPFAFVRHFRFYASLEEMYLSEIRKTGADHHADES